MPASPRANKSSNYKSTSKETLKRLSLQQAAAYRSFLIEELSKLEEILNELVPSPPPSPNTRTYGEGPLRDRPRPSFIQASQDPSQTPPKSSQEIPNVEFSLASPMDPMFTEAELLGDIQNLYDYPNTGTGSQLHTESFGTEAAGGGTEESDFDSP